MDILVYKYFKMNSWRIGNKYIGDKYAYINQKSGNQLNARRISDDYYYYYYYHEEARKQFFSPSISLAPWKIDHFKYKTSKLIWTAEEITVLGGKNVQNGMEVWQHWYQTLFSEGSQYQLLLFTFDL